MEQNGFQRGGSAYLTDLIARAVARGEREAVARGRWEIDEAVRLPGDFTLILDGCHLRMADGCYATLFVNEHHDTPPGRTAAGTDRNVALIGRNGAVLDGGAYNGLSERNAGRNGLPPIWKNNLVLFTNVDGFTVRGLSCRNFRWWALNFLFCAHGRLTDLDFLANDAAVGGDGRPYRGLRHDRYDEILVKNADGIDLRQGCHDILIENVTGFTEDDSVALTRLDGEMERRFAVEGLTTDLYNVTVRNVATSALCANVRLLSQCAGRFYNVLIDGVTDTSLNSPHMDRGGHGVRIGDARRYGDHLPTADEFFDITVRRVRSRAACVLSLAGEVGNLVLEEIEGFDGAEALPGVPG